MKKFWAVAVHKWRQSPRDGAKFGRFGRAFGLSTAWIVGVGPVGAASDTAAASPGERDVAGFERVSLPTGGGTPERLTALFRRPATTAPAPAVVLLHGCGGLWSRTGDLGARDRAWADILVGQGYAVLFPDSFGSRGAGSQCRRGERVARAWGARTGDVDAARAWLAARPDIDPARLFLIGFSNGGSTVLSAVRPVAAPASGDFRAAVAFYPGCRSAAASRRWASRLDLLILIGEADDWTPAAPCHALAEAHADRVTIVGYPGAWHGFDHPSSPVRLRHGLAFTASGGGDAHVGSDPAARADAISRVEAWLAAHSR